MKRTRNITVSVSESTYHQARVWAARHCTSISAVAQFLLENLPVVSRAVHTLREEDPNFGTHTRARQAPAPPAPTPHKNLPISGCETVERTEPIENQQFTTRKLHNITDLVTLRNCGF